VNKTVQKKETISPEGPVVQVVGRVVPTVKTWTLPSGAVIDDAGHIISSPVTTTVLDSTIQAGSRVMTGEEIYSSVSPSVVFITWQDQNNKYEGSGFVINDGKYVITNAHVLKSSSGFYASKVYVHSYSGSVYDAVVLGKVEESDIALLYIGSRDLKSSVLGSSGGSLKVGATVYALGYPELFQGLSTVTFTKGTLSAKQQNFGNYPGTTLQMDAAINHGNSGGPLVNEKAEVVGMNTSSLVGTQGIYFAVPIDTIKSWIPALSQYGLSRYELYPVGTTLTILKSIQYRIDLNEKLSCVELGFRDNDLTMCNLYKNNKSDYNWVIQNDI
jgi:S1-C subfamily serine protease